MNIEVLQISSTKYEFLEVKTDFKKMAYKDTYLKSPKMRLKTLARYVSLIVSNN